MWTKFATRPQSGSQAVFNDNQTVIPGVDYLLNKGNAWYVGGRIEGVPIFHYDFRGLRLTPAELRANFHVGLATLVAFQTRNPMHRAHQELTFRAAKQVEANLLIIFVGYQAGRLITSRVCADPIVDSNIPLHRKLSMFRAPCVWAGRARPSGRARPQEHGCTHLMSAVTTLVREKTQRQTLLPVRTKRRKYLRSTKRTSYDMFFNMMCTWKTRSICPEDEVRNGAEC